MNSQSILLSNFLMLFVGVALFVDEAVSANDAIVEANKYSTLQEAADAIPSSGGVLRIGPGMYELDQPLRIKTGDTRVVGCGTSTHIVNKNEEGMPAILIENPKFTGKVTPGSDRLWRVNVADLRITGNDKSGAGIEARYIEEILIEGVSSSYNGGDGIRLYFCYEDPRIVKNLITYNKKCGVYLEGCHDIVVNANQFEENLDALQCLDCFNLAMSGNNIDDHLRHGVVIENTYGSVVASNMIEECQGWGIVLDRDCYGITLSANVIAHEFSGGIDLADAHGCTISANSFPIVKHAAIAVRKGSAAHTITGNSFSDTWIGNDKDGTAIQKRAETSSGAESNPNEAAGILLEDCEAIVISGNLFSRLTTASVEQTANCKNIVQNANVVVER